MGRWLLVLCAAACAPPPDPPGRDSRVEAEALAPPIVLYELQVRTANACDPQVGSAAQREACARKPAPVVATPAPAAGCPDLEALERIRLGTLEDLMADTADPRQGITLRYVRERLGANALWLMPVFPDNAEWGIDSACDNLGSPYAVRDYLHVAGSLSRACLAEGTDRCWGNASLDALIAEAHARGIKVVLDVAFNHLGHNYLFYDSARFTPVRERIARGEDLDALWDFAATFEPALVHPEVLDSAEELVRLADADAEIARALAGLRARCPALGGDELVRGFGIWREALDWERAQLACDALFLEFAAPGFYVGADHFSPSRGPDDTWASDGFQTWNDVKFLYHHEDNAAHEHELVRNREYLFRVMNHWASRGVDGFRLDHATDRYSGLGPNEWRYLAAKVGFYSAKRGQARPILLAEEFHEQEALAPVVDIMTEGYVHDITRPGLDTARAEAVLDNAQRLSPTLVMTALETHDEQRLLEASGWNVWTGAGFWGLGASSWSVPMILMGQELGEPRRLAFRQSDYLRSRFEGAPGYRADGDTLIDLYRRMIQARNDPRNRALRSPRSWFLRTRSGGVDPRLLARARWSEDANVVFTFFNLWEQPVTQSYALPPDLAAQLALSDDLVYRLVDAIGDGPGGPCRTGRELARELRVDLDAGTRMKWLRLERCDEGPHR